MFPGLCGEAPTMAVRVFLGTQPAMNVERLLLRNVQGVYAWYTSRRRVKEQASEFLELDATGIDAETMLRYAHVHYVRRSLADDLVERQLALLDQGKPPQAADPAALACLSDCLVEGARALDHELSLLAKTKATTSGLPGRRELDPASPLGRGDILAMMRCFEEDVAGIDEVESKCRAFLPTSAVQKSFAELLRLLCPGPERRELDKKDAKQLGRMVLPDYAKIGCVEKLRPLDVTAYFRFSGERLCGAPRNDFFRRALWGNIFRQYATHPHMLRSLSQYWTAATGLEPNPPLLQLPTNLAEAACASQRLFPALKFQSIAMYTSVDAARQHWRSDTFVPHPRVYPLLGSQAAQEAVAGILVDGQWARLKLAPNDNPRDEHVVAHLRAFVDEACALYNENLDGLLQRVGDAYKVAVPAPQQAAKGATEAGAAQPQPPQATASE